MGPTVVALLMLSIGRVAGLTVGEDGGYDGVVVRVGQKLLYGHTFPYKLHYLTILFFK